MLCKSDKPSIIIIIIIIKGYIPQKKNTAEGEVRGV